MQEPFPATELLRPSHKPLPFNAELYVETRGTSVKKQSFNLKL